jgi:hypothetical protein
MGAWRFVALWYPGVIVGYALAVFITRHSPREGWDFLVKHWGLAMALLAFPMPWIALHWVLGWVSLRVDRNGGPPAAA